MNCHFKICCTIRAVPKEMPRTKAGTHAIALARSAWGHWWSTVAAAVASTALACVLYRPWEALSSAPFDSSGDVWAYLLYIRNLLEGNLNHTARLGAPFGQQLYDFPQGGEFSHMVLFRIIGLFTQNPIAVLNISYLIGFGLVAAATEFVARELGFSRLYAISIALLVAFLPYRFGQGEAHITLAAYWAAPLGLLLAMWAAQGRMPIPRLVVPKGQWTRAESRRALIATFCVVVGASSDAYYLAFNVLLIITGALISQLRVRSWRNFIAPILPILGMLAVFILIISPTLIWRMHHGVNLHVAQRSVADSQSYGLQIAQLILPGPGSRISPLANLGVKIRSVTSPGEDGSYLGFIGLLGLISATVVLLRRGVARGNGRSTRKSRFDDIPSDVALLAWSSVVISTAGGIGLVVSALGFTQIRTWSRMALYPAMCGIFAAAWMFQRYAQPELIKKRGKGLAVVGLIVIFGLLDQIPRTISPSPAVALNPTRALIANVEQVLPRNAMVFQLPVVSFPEANPIFGLQAYDQAIPYVIDRGKLRWSFGGMRGRRADWQINWGQLPTDTMVRGIAVAGFDALWVDDRGYSDHGSGLHRQLDRLLGPPHAISSNGYQRWYDLRPLRRHLAAENSAAAIATSRELILNSATALVVNDSISPVPPAPGLTQQMVQNSSIVLHNPLAAPRSILLHINATAIVPSTLTLSTGRFTEKVRLSPHARTTAIRLTVPSGTTVLAASTDAPGDPNGRLVFVGGMTYPSVTINKLFTTDPQVTSVVG